MARGRRHHNRARGSIPRCLRGIPSVRAS
jgi:hypothetical protein